MKPEKIKIKTRDIKLSKAIHDAEFQVKTVLTLDPFDYVDLWLRRNHKNEALFYWRQARDFHRAAQGLPMESAPLVLYYSFMNAAKALLSSKEITFQPYHGVKLYSVRNGNGKAVLSNEGIEIKKCGIVPALITYFNEVDSRNKYSLEAVFYNLAFIHRTYCLSYPNKREIFLPLKNLEFLRDSNTNEVWFSADVSENVDWKFFRKRLPSEVIADPSGLRKIKSAKSIRWSSLNKPTEAELEDLKSLNKNLRRVLHYINGADALWYLKSNSAYQIDRHPITLTLAAMHRLSEICRYKPAHLRSFLNGQKNWLLSEFVAMAPPQFMDEIACEMTGHQIMNPNSRIPT